MKQLLKLICFETLVVMLLVRKARSSIAHFINDSFLGMSTVHEVTLAAHCGFRTLGIALITNKCLWDYNTTYEPVHEDVIRISELKANDLQQLIFDFVGTIKEHRI
jgi:purine-nucleoside phosphorylase